jgi:cold shock CspA family protein
MATGTILWFDSGRGFGFIRPDLGPRDVFVHATALDGATPEQVGEGVPVEFELVQAGDGRLVARRVQLRGGAGPNRRARDS